MKRYEEDLVAVVEDILRSVAMVEVEIQNRHFPGCTQIVRLHLMERRAGSLSDAYQGQKDV